MIARSKYCENFMNPMGYLKEAEELVMRARQRYLNMNPIKSPRREDILWEMYELHVGIERLITRLKGEDENEQRMD